MSDLWIKGMLAGIVFFGVLQLAGLHTWLERKQSALMQDRIGANRASIFGLRLFGLFHPLADVVKLLRGSGYGKAFNVRGGIIEWMNQQLPVETGDG